nr:RNA-directed DNA polymerase, eukaryota [Tanacetum cinerariifolium]
MEANGFFGLRSNPTASDPSTIHESSKWYRFIKVINLDRLIENLNTIWIGRFHLFANPVRFERPKKPNLSPHNNAAAASSYPRGVDQAKGQFQTRSYVNVLNGSFPMGVHGPSIPSASVLVLDDSCVAERDLSNHVMGKVKDVSSISNLRTLIMKEGFSVVNLVYLEGEWFDDNFKGVMVGECMSRHNAWASTVDKLRSRLSKWKVKTLSIGGRLTLLKAVLGASPLYNMSFFKVPKGILNSMEAIRSKFFNGMEPSTKKITWAAWNKVLASKENEGL